ncbi:MAG: hypothetical protein ACOY3I_01405 [Verrucomicrobiota bacterium]
MRAYFQSWGIKGAVVLFSFLLFVALKWHTTCFSKGMDGIQAIQASSVAPAETPHQRTALVDSSAPWEIILAQEQALARNYFGATSSTVAAKPTVQPTLPTLPALHTSYRTLQIAPATDEISTENLAAQDSDGMQKLPVENFATQEEFLKMAKVDFDASQQRWSATWEKPQMFHFGMLLKPALVEKLEPGSSYSFESHGVQAVLTRTQDDQLVLQRGSETIDLTASNLRDLLHDKISVNGVQLFLDRRGNLVMQAHGQKAVNLSSNTRL